MLSSLFEPNVDKLKSDRNIKGLIKALHHGKYIIRGDAAEALGEVGTNEVIRHLLSTLNDEHHYPRLSSFQTLVKIGKEQSDEIQSFFKTLSTERVKEFLAHRFGLEKSQSEASVRFLRESGAPIPAYDLICDYAKGPREETRKWIISIGKSAFDPLLKAIKERVGGGNGVAELVTLAGYIGDIRAIPHIVQLLQRKKAINNNVRRAAAEALGLLGDPSVIESLKAILSSKNSDVADSALTALEKLEWKPLTEEDHTRLALCSKVLLSSTDSDVLSNRLKALSKLGWKPSEEDRINMAIVSEDRIVLESIGPRATSMLAEIVKKRDSDKRGFAASMLAKKDPDMLRKAWDWDGKLQIAKQSSSNSLHIDDIEEHLLYTVLSDIRDCQDYTLFLITGLRGLPENPTVVEALIPNLNVYTWWGDIGRVGVGEKLTKLSAAIDSHPEERYLVWGPSSEDLFDRLACQHPRSIIYIGGDAGYQRILK